jgi:hypothetical protein
MLLAAAALFTTESLFRARTDGAVRLGLNARYGASAPPQACPFDSSPESVAGKLTVPVAVDC